MNKRQPTVSIVTVCFNAAATIEQTIRSVIEQSYDPIEYIIVDGGSTDKTLDIIRRHEGDISQWRSEPDRGMYDAMNKALHMATGDYIGILNADDWLEPDAVRTIVSTFETHGCDYTFGDVYLADTAGARFGLMCALYPEELGRAALYKMPFPHQSCYIKNEVLRSIGNYSLDYRLSADHEFIIRLIQSGAKGVRLPTPIATYRMGGAGGGKRTFLESRAIALKYGMSRTEATARYMYSLAAVSLVRFLPRRLTRALLRAKSSRHIWF